MWPCGKEKPPELERIIKANSPEDNAFYQYANNFICTSKYTVLSFLPKNLFEQFRRLANSYFLSLLVLQVIIEIQQSITYRMPYKMTHNKNQTFYKVINYVLLHIFLVFMIILCTF